jgi:hypothetical protein
MIRFFSTLLLINTLVNQSCHGLSRQMTFGLWATYDQVSYVWIGDDIADYFLKSNILGLHTSRESCPGFYPSPYKDPTATGEKSFPLRYLPSSVG